MALNNTIKALMENKEFMEKAIAIKDVDKLAKLFAENGVDAPMEEISAAIEEYVKTLDIDDAEFSEDELEAVSGGKSNVFAEFVFGCIAAVWNVSFGPLTGTKMVQRGR